MDCVIPYRDRVAWTVDETCQLLGLGRTTIYQLLAEGKIEAIRVGRRRLILVRSALALIEPSADGLGVAR